LYVRDLVDAMVYIRNVAHNAYNVFNIGVDSATSVARIARIVTEEMNLPDVTLHYTGGNVGWKGDVPRFSYDTSRLRDLGWKPAVESDEAVRLATRAILSGTKD
jgi:UDP-glucose 4-epimerase